MFKNKVGKAFFGLFFEETIEIKMHILYLHQFFKLPQESGGTRSYDLATAFKKKGFKVEIITSSSELEYKGRKRWTTIKKNGLLIHYIYLPYNNNFSNLKRIWTFIKFLWFTTFKLLSLKGDIVLATSTPLTIGIPALVKKKLHKTLFVFEVRDVWPEAVIAIGAIKNKIAQKLLFKLEQVIYKNASAIVPLSTDMRASIISRYSRFSKKPVKVIENISEINRFQNSYDKNVSVLKDKIGFIPRFPILYAGTFGKVNGINFVINFAEKLIHIDPSIVFVLIGDGAEKNTIIQKATDKGLINKNVFILDAVSKQDLPQLYFECSMGSSFVIPIKELWANSANKFFDTLAAGRPILINHKGWQKEVIENENLGYLLPREVCIEDAKEFVYYTQNQNLISVQRENALRIAKQKYALEVATTRYIKLFDRVKK